MAQKIEDYALISDCHTAALIAKNGSIDWLCLPSYDSPSTFGALLGNKNHGRWKLAPTHTEAHSTRSYEGDSFILVTHWTTPGGEVEVIDTMPHGDRRADVLRRIRGIRGSVEMHQDLRIRFGYADAIPWVRQVREKSGRALLAVAGPDAIIFRGPKLHPDNHSHSSTFVVRAGETVDISLTWFPSHRETPGPVNYDIALRKTREWWSEWATTCKNPPAYRNEVVRSLLVLRALTHEDTSGIVAAATTSLPEKLGGERNWDYRYVWLRDASLALQALLAHGYHKEATDWRGWLLRAIAGDPADVQIMYGLGGERYLPEHEVTSLPGYRGSSPVRIGNRAVEQYQADVIGRVMVALHVARKEGIPETQFSWPLQRALISFVESNWQRADHGIWEVRGPAQHFTHSRVMTWAALDRAIAAVNEFGLDGPVDRWIELRSNIRLEIEENGFDPQRNSYVQHYGTTQVDAALLQLPQVGFCDADDPRMLGTVAAIENDLMHNGLLYRYRTEEGIDGLPSGENPFLACSFWLVKQYARSGRIVDARVLMDRLVGLCNDVGLLAEEVSSSTGQHAGNTPQALSHLALVEAADAISEAEISTNTSQ
jgi:GH15 family glucan-1,4-alpha-glucosidase